MITSGGGKGKREIITPGAAVRKGLGPSASLVLMLMLMLMPMAMLAVILLPILLLLLLLLTIHQVRCLERVRSALGPAARLFVAVDAPKLQAIIFDELGARAFITPGT